MPVIQPGILPASPVRPRFGDYLGEGFSSGAEKSTDLLLQALLSGQLGQQPTPATLQNPGTFNFPPGSQSPGEASQIQRMGGVPTPGGLLVRATQVPSTTGISYTSPTKFGLGTGLERQYKQSEIEKNKAMTAMYGGGTPLFDSSGTIIGTVPYHAKAAPGASTGASFAEKAYEFHTRSIDQYQKPVDERLDRLSRLQDTMNQYTPQADALLAPELLTVMAGGQGSGLRMNEAEIARIVGGRTHWESLKAALNKYQLNPAAGVSVTPAQRQQMRDLVKTVQQKLLAKQDILNGARQQLLDSDDPKEFRGVIVQMRKSLQGIDDNSVNSVTPVGGVLPSRAQTDPHLATLQQQFPGAKITKVK